MKKKEFYIAFFEIMGEERFYDGPSFWFKNAFVNDLTAQFPVLKSEVFFTHHISKFAWKFWD